MLYVVMTLLVLFIVTAFAGCNSSSSSVSEHEGGYTVEECKVFAERDFKEHWRETASFYSIVNGVVEDPEIRIRYCEYLGSRYNSTPDEYVFRVVGRARCNSDVYEFGSYMKYNYKTGKKIVIENDRRANISKGEELDERNLFGYK